MSRATFWNLFAKRYARMPVGDQASYERKLALTREILRPDMRLLEVGCGTGSTALYHAPVVAHIDAIDFASAMIAIAKEKAWNQSVLNVDFRVAALEDLPETPLYDVALGLSLLHLLDDQARGLHDLSSRVRPGGYVITSTVCLKDIGGWLSRLVPWIGLTGILPKVAPLGKADIIAMHDAADLTITKMFQADSDKSLFVIAQKPDQSAA